MELYLGFILILLIGVLVSRVTLFRKARSKASPILFLAGLEYLLIGFLVGPRVMNFLSENALRQLSPVVALGLGWIGLLVGLQFDRKVLFRIAPVYLKTALAVTLGTFSIVFLLIYCSKEALIDPLIGIATYPRPAEFDPIPASVYWFEKLGFCLLLSCSAVVTAYATLALIKKDSDARGEATKMLQLLCDLKAPIAIAMAGLWYSFFHVSTWGLLADPKTQLRYAMVFDLDRLRLGSLENASDIVFMAPVMVGVLWLIVSILLGLSLGWILHYLTSERLQANEMLLVMAGASILSSGLATYLHLSPLFVNLVMGTTLTNLPNFMRGRVSNLMIQTEKPFFVIFLICIGAIWPRISWGIIAVAFLLCGMRFFGLYVGLSLSRKWIQEKTNAFSLLTVGMMPQGGIAIAIAADYYMIYAGRYQGTVLSIVLFSVLMNQLIGGLLMSKMFSAISKNQNSDLLSPGSVA